jgi:hypothetical protein
MLLSDACFVFMILFPSDGKTPGAADSVRDDAFFVCLDPADHNLKT